MFALKMAMLDHFGTTRTPLGTKTLPNQFATDLSKVIFAR